MLQDDVLFHLNSLFLLQKAWFDGLYGDFRYFSMEL